MMNTEEILASYQEAIENINFDVRGKEDQTIKEQMSIFSYIDDSLQPDIYGKELLLSHLKIKWQNF